MRGRWRCNAMQNKMKHKRIEAYRRGRKGEMLASGVLMLKGYRILARRWQCALGEIDLIARRGDTLVFMEVKARPSEAEALEAVTHRQRQRIAQAAGAFLQTLPDRHRYACRFDVMAYTGRLRLVHVRDAWRL